MRSVPSSSASSVRRRRRHSNRARTHCRPNLPNLACRGQKRVLPPPPPPPPPRKPPRVRAGADNPEVVDPCGPSPVLIHLPQLRRLTPEWLQLSFELKRDPEADKQFGWVLEMWGYTLAATRLGIRHLVWKEFQAEPSSLWNSDLEGGPHIYHYTFGLAAWSKRRLGGATVHSTMVIFIAPSRRRHCWLHTYTHTYLLTSYSKRRLGGATVGR